MGLLQYSFPQSEYTTRNEKAKKLMEEAGLDALFITDACNYWYFTGIRVTRHIMRPSLAIIPRDGEPALVSYRSFLSRTTFQDERFTWIKDQRPYVDVPFNNDPVKDWGIKSIIEDRGLSKGTIGTELGVDTRFNLPYNDFVKLQRDFPKAKFVDASKIFWGLRLIKSEAELNLMRKACEINGRAFERLLNTIEIGMTIDEVEKLLYMYFVKEGADQYGAGVGVLKGASGPNGTFKRGDILKADYGSYYKGYGSDICRLAIFGEPTEEQKKYDKIALDLLQSCMDVIKAGIKISDIHSVCNTVLKREGLTLMLPGKRIGHGFGIEAEPPSINAIDNTILKPGMILTPEPRFSINQRTYMYEETIVVTKDSYECLSKTPPRELRIIK